MDFLYGFVVIRRFLLLVFICLSLRCVNRLLYSVVCCMVFWLFLGGFNFGFHLFELCESFVVRFYWFLEIFHLLVFALSSLKSCNE